ncbi:MAG: hypothetical protein RIB67_03975 [Miltoncostaeaceae bacterium]
MLALLVLFVILALIFGIGGAVEISLWFLLLVAIAAIVGAVVAGRFLRGTFSKRD